MSDARTARMVASQGETVHPPRTPKRYICHVLTHSWDLWGIVEYEGEPRPSVRCSRCSEFRILPQDGEVPTEYARQVVADGGDGR